MTDVNPLLNSTLAGQIAQKLDAADGTKDGKIEKSIWDAFAKEHGGKTIKESIDVESAMNSITTYVVKGAKSSGKGINDLAQEWLNKDYAPATESGTGAAEGASAGDKSGEAGAAQGAAAAAEEEKAPAAEETTPENTTNSVQKDFDSVKVNIWRKQLSEITKAQKEAQAIVKELKALEQEDRAAKAGKPGAKMLNNPQGRDKLINILKRINKNNVVYVVHSFPQIATMIDDIDLMGAGLDQNDVYKYVLKHLVNKAKELKLPTKYHGECMKMSLDEMKKTIKDLKTKILDANNRQVRVVNQFNKDLPKIRKTFDDANRFLAEVANMNPKPAIDSGHNEEGDYDWKQANLPDGRWIEVQYDKNGEITRIMISHDTTPNKNSDGSTYDGADVEYTKDKAKYDTYQNNSAWEGSITSGYDFEKLKAVAKKIFG